MKQALNITLTALALATLSVEARADSQDKARVLFRTLTGTPLQSADVRLSQMATKIDAGDLKGAAAIATEDSNFFDVTLVQWASHLSTRDEFPRVTLNDFIATVVGTAIDNRDARLLLSDDSWYVGTNLPGLPAVDGQSNDHYAFLERSRVPLRGHLIRQSPQRAGSVGAGLLTTWTWLKQHAGMGTNRRAVEFTFREFLCKPIRELADLNAPRDRIRRDVDRTPGSNPMVFNNRCAGCHSLLDGFGGAFAHLDFTFNDAMRKETGTVTITTDPAAKMNQNGTVYPAGYVTLDDSWVNNARFNANEALGWRGPVEGNGPQAFGGVVAGSRAFSVCMAKRAFSQLCINTDYVVDRLTATQQDQLDAASSQIEGLASDFESSGYNLRHLFEATSVLPKCLDR